MNLPSINRLYLSLTILVISIFAYIFKLQHPIRLANKNKKIKLIKISSIIKSPLLFLIIFLYIRIFILPHPAKERIILWFVHLNTLLVIISLIGLLFERLGYLVFILGERFDVHKPDDMNAMRILIQLKI
mgnify:CR=1 FL=1